METNNMIIADVDHNLHQMIEMVSGIKNPQNKEVLQDINTYLNKAHELIHNNIDFENLDDEG